jgi:hypothetical protein
VFDYIERFCKTEGWLGSNGGLSPMGHKENYSRDLSSVQGAGLVVT